MTGVVVAVLLWAGFALCSPAISYRSSGGSRLLQAKDEPIGTPQGWLRGPAKQFAAVRAARRQPVDLHELTLFVHQLAGLLRAGRAPHLLWKDMEQIYCGDHGPFSTAALPVLTAARRAADLGLSIPDVLGQARVYAGQRRGEPGVLAQVDLMWTDLAACLQVSERSGAPLAMILEQYAVQLDAHLDGVSARETALAGPRATVILLAWLPAAGVLLGFALGVNPLHVLLGSTLGRLALASGLLLMLVSRIWSRQLVRRAAGATP